MAGASYNPYGSEWGVGFLWHRMDWLVRFDVVVLGLLLARAVIRGNMMGIIRNIQELQAGRATQARLERTLHVVFLLIAGASCAFPQSTPGLPIQQIMALEHQRATAVVHGDTDFLEKITAGDSVRILPTGALQSKADLLAELKSGSVVYTSIKVDELSVKVYGITAVVTGKSVVEGRRNGKTFGGSWRFSRVWIRNEGHWQEVLFQVTPIPKT